MICHAYKCLFFHNRKTGGTSINSAFGFDLSHPDCHIAADGVLSPKYIQFPEDYMRFTVVRNPWDRFISGWKFCPATKDKPLLEVLQNLPTEGWTYRHLARQQYPLLYQDGRLMVDCVMRFETLQQDFDLLCDQLGKPRAKLPRLNTTERGHYSQYFDETTRELCTNHFQRDIELLGYTF